MSVASPWRTAEEGLVFGVFPGGPEENHDRVSAALDELRGSHRLLVRSYLPSMHPGAPTAPPPIPAQPDRYVTGERPLDLVLGYGSPDGDVTGFVAHIRRAIRRFGPLAASVQITEEPNVTDRKLLDGYFPRVLDALVDGVVAAKEEAHAAGFDALRVGFNTAPVFENTPTFFDRLGERAGEDFHTALDYVGFDFFPDVFGPIPSDMLPGAVTGLLRAHRTERLAEAGIDASVPLHITEHGWPTGPDRPAERQAERLETIIRLVHGLRTELNIERYTLFSLAAFEDPGFDGDFGVLHADGTPKPAFTVLRGLIEELGC